MDMLRIIGWDKENHKPIWRQMYFVLSIFIIIPLIISAIPTLELDDWGYDSIYMQKTLFITLSLMGGYYVWGYIELLKRVEILEERFQLQDKGVIKE